jgi:uncharacterized OsmC-like protein
MPTMTFKASTRWSGESTYCESSARGFQVAMDEPKALGGTDRAMNPVEMLLCSLGGCLCICAVAFAAECGVELTGVRAEIEGDLDPDGFFGLADVRKGYQQVRYRLILDSPSPSDHLNRLARTIKERCPVSDTLAGVEVIADITH